MMSKARNCITALFVCASNASIAAPIVFTGFDLANSADPRPLSNAAAAAFDAAVNESVITFESAPVGGFSTLTVAPGVTLGSNQSIRNSPSGTPDRLFGYNTTAGGTNFVELFGGNITFTFATPIEAFGLYISGQQLNNNTITFNDGTAQTIPIPFTSSGGIAFLGFTDIGAAITSVSINTPIDIVGFDDVRFAAVAETSPAVPEPGSLALLGAALGGFGLSRRRKKA
jgi:hypothetical protein